MFLEYTISQLDIGPVPEAEARRMGHLGYMQWIASLPGQTGYAMAAQCARDAAAPLLDRSPALAVFHDLINTSLTAPLKPLALSFAQQSRRGGAAGRRAARSPF